MSESSEEIEQHPAADWEIVQRIQTERINDIYIYGDQLDDLKVELILDYFTKHKLSANQAKHVAYNFRNIINITQPKASASSIAAFINAMVDNYQEEDIYGSIVGILNLLSRRYPNFLRQNIIEQPGGNVEYLMFCLLTDRGYSEECFELLGKTPTILAEIFIVACTRVNFRLLKRLTQRYEQVLSRSEFADSIRPFIKYLQIWVPDNTDLLKFDAGFQFIVQTAHTSNPTHQQILLGFIEIYWRHLSGVELAIILQQTLEEKNNGAQTGPMRHAQYMKCTHFYERLYDLADTKNNVKLNVSIRDFISDQFFYAAEVITTPRDIYYDIAFGVLDQLLPSEAVNAILTEQGETILHLCWNIHTPYNNLEANILALLESGANPFIPSQSGRAPFLMSLNALAQSYNRVEIKPSATTSCHESRLSAILRLTETPLSEIIEMCDEQQKLTLLCYFCQTRLHWEAFPEHKLMVRHSTDSILSLCEQLFNRDPNMARCIGRFPLHYAIDQATSDQEDIKVNAQEFIKELLSLNCLEVNQTLSYGGRNKRPIELVNNGDLVLLLMRNGARIFDTSPRCCVGTVESANSWQRRICRAIKSAPRNMDEIQACLDLIAPKDEAAPDEVCLAYLNAQLANGKTLLTYCISKQAKEVYLLLQGYGADDSIKNAGGKSAKELMPVEFQTKCPAPKTPAGSSEYYG